MWYYYWQDVIYITSKTYFNLLQSHFCFRWVKVCWQICRYIVQNQCFDVKAIAYFILFLFLNCRVDFSNSMSFIVLLFIGMYVCMYVQTKIITVSPRTASTQIVRFYYNTINFFVQKCELFEDLIDGFSWIFFFLFFVGENDAN